jgi:hypothetical protein
LEAWEQPDFSLQVNDFDWKLMLHFCHEIIAEENQLYNVGNQVDLGNTRETLNYHSPEVRMSMGWRIMEEIREDQLLQENPSKRYVDLSAKFRDEAIGGRGGQHR